MRTEKESEVKEGRLWAGQTVAELAQSWIKARERDRERYGLNE